MEKSEKSEKFEKQNPIDVAVAAWMEHRDMKRAGDVLREMERLCWHYVNKRQGVCDARGVSLNDLFQEAQMGVLMALQKYEPEESPRFTNYAMWWIHSHINKFLEREHGTGLGKPYKRLIYQYGYQYSKISSEDPTLTQQEIQERIASHPRVHCSVEEVDRYAQLSRNDRSLDEPLAGDTLWTLLDTISGQDDPESDYADALASRRLRDIVDSFCGKKAPRDRDLIKMRIASPDYPDTLQAVADRWCCTRERIRQIEAQTMPELFDFCTARM